LRWLDSGLRGLNVDTLLGPKLDPIALWRDIRPGSMLADKRSDPVGIIASVSQQH
jgi:hypothetical protein